jgi:DNA-damage-inducible protein J
MKTETIRARVEPSVKHQAEAILKTLGISPTDAITLFYHQIALQNGLPFSVKIPNQETQEAMEEINDDESLKTYSAQEFHELLNAL